MKLQEIPAEDFDQMLAAGDALNEAVKLARHCPPLNDGGSGVAANITSALVALTEKLCSTVDRDHFTAMDIREVAEDEGVSLRDAYLHVMWDLAEEEAS